jgi:hypothetical protein
MKYRICICSFFLFASAGRLPADILSSQITSPIALQPDAGLMVTGGVTQAFFSDLTGLTFPGPGIVDILSNVQAFDDMGDPIGSFAVTGVNVTQGASNSTPALTMFDLPSPITYSATLNPGDQVVVDPANLNYAFVFDTDASLQYSYTLDVIGVPDGGFVLYDDVEGAQATPEPGTWALVLAGGLVMAFVRMIRSPEREQL